MQKPIDGFVPTRVGRKNSIDNIHFIDTPFYRPYWSHIEKTGPAPRARAQRQATVDDFLDFIYIGLKTYQGYWESHGTNPYMVYFPFALSLDKGDKVFNIKQRCNYSNSDNIVAYTIKSLVRSAGQNVVLLDGNEAPHKDDTLILDESSNKIADFHVGYPNSEIGHQYFTEDQLSENAANPWVDTITYRILKTEPAGARDLFQGRREYKPRVMETQYESLQGRNVEYRVQSFDSNIQFDCWAETNERAENLASWFRYFMNLYIPIFQENGVIQCIFLGKMEDIHVTRWRDDIIARSLVYGVRTQEVTAYDVGVFHSLRAGFDLGIDGNLETISILKDDLPSPSNELSGVII